MCVSRSVYPVYFHCIHSFTPFFPSFSFPSAPFSDLFRFFFEPFGRLIIHQCARNTCVSCFEHSCLFEEQSCRFLLSNAIGMSELSEQACSGGGDDNEVMCSICLDAVVTRRGQASRDTKTLPCGDKTFHTYS